MRCVVTAGPTYEPLDGVRRLTNFSTGKLGAELARYLASRGHETILLLAESAAWRGEGHPAQVIPFTTTASLRDALIGLRDRSMEAVFHAAAVSDFIFGQAWERGEDGALQPITGGKLSTRSGTLVAELHPAPKLLPELRNWFPNARLVGWKYEVDGSAAEVIVRARRQLAECGTDACVANGAAYGAGFGVVLAQHPEVRHCPDSASLYTLLESVVNG
jgi:phosphopantothenoylcysteine decarboxylase/phosphopantothenate--cysteine ligase